MSDEINEPGALVLTLFNRLVDKIKSSTPVRTDGKALTTGFVYAQLPLGMPVDPRDYANPWSPMGGSTLQDAANAAQPAPAGQPAASGGGAKPAPDPKFRSAIEAAFKTSKLVDKMIMVTNDDSWLEYPTGRQLSFAYDGVIHAMQPLPMPPISPDVQKQIDDAQKLLYEMDGDGNIMGKSQLYKNYIRNAEAYAQAKKDYADAQAAQLADPVKADTWPQDSVTYQQKVDDALDTWKTESADKVERALDIIGSVGVSLQDHMIAKARQLYDVWNLGLAGVPDPVPYSYISPTSWYDPDADDDGWQRLTINQGDYHSHTDSHSGSTSTSSGHSDSSSTSGGGGVSFGFIMLGGDGGSSSANSSSDSSASGSSQSHFHNDAHGLQIDLEYALCTINRPWLVSDLFYMKNWYLVGNPKNAVSDGTVNGQVKSDKPLLPMIPEQFLAIRNVKITASDWGSDGQTLSSYFASSHSDSESSSSNESGGGAVCLGFVNFGGSASHSNSNSDSHASSTSSGDSSSDYGAHWDGQTLEIRGAQIIAWLSEIVPACAPLDDPNLKTK